MYFFYFAIYILEQRGFELQGNILRPRNSVVQGVTVISLKYSSFLVEADQDKCHQKNLCTKLS